MDAPVFEEPWQAQIFAITVQLSEAGVFSWPDWTRVFGARLAEHRLAKDLNGGSDYFAAWLDALEHILGEAGLAPGGEIDRAASDWRQAYLATPHGAPVRLAEDERGGV